MEIFQPVFSQMLTMILLMALGFTLRKTNIIPENTGSTLSKLTMYLFTPANLFYNQLNFCSVENLTSNSPLILFGAALFIFTILLSYPLSHLFVPKKTGDSAEDYQRCIYKYAIAMGNFGFAGNYIVQNVWGEEAFFKYSLFTFAAQILALGWGLYMLIPKDKGQSIFKSLRKGLLTPPMIFMVLGMICGLFNVKQYIPTFILTAADNLSKCFGPVAMLIAGIIIGGYSFKDMFGSIKVYILIALRLFLMPALIISILLLLSKFGLYSVSNDIYKYALLAFCVPCGMNTLVYPATYGGDTKTGSGMVLISNVLSIITIPLMFMLLTSII